MHTLYLTLMSMLCFLLLNLGENGHIEWKHITRLDHIKITVMRNSLYCNWTLILLPSGCWCLKISHSVITFLWKQNYLDEKYYLYNFPTLKLYTHQHDEPINSWKCMGVYSALWLLMPWCWCTRPSVLTVLMKYSMYWANFMPKCYICCEHFDE